MNDQPSTALRLFGTEEAVPPLRRLRAGPLEAVLDAGALRYIRIAGREAIRGIAFLVRDTNWGTYAPAIEELRVEEGTEGFSVHYRARCGTGDAVLDWEVAISGRADGGLDFRARAVPRGDFPTNRTGFVVLHPIDGVAGAPVELLTADGTRETTRFPAAISPHQPMMNIRALTHEVLPGLRVTCRMEGDVFEMEDQRNWTDASYKTYVRPLGLPYPYMLPSGVPVEQAVTLTLEGAPPAAATAAGPVRVTVGAPAGRVPRFGLGLEPEHLETALSAAPAIAALRPGLLLAHFDARRHGVEDLRRIEAVRRAIGAPVTLEAIIPGRDATAEVAALADRIAEAGLVLEGVAPMPARDRMSRPTGLPAGEAGADAIARAAREALPGVAIGGGMPSYFTEINRNRPPAGLLDWVGHGTAAIVHAADDVSVMETLQALPAVFETARGFLDGKPYRVGPIAIGMRWNPYGAAIAPNPDQVRMPMARIDPRQRGLFGAAWMLGYAAHAARAGLDALIVGAPTGPFGLIHDAAEGAAAGYGRTGQLFPIFHVAAGLAAAAGAPLRDTAIDAGDRVQALAWQDGDRIVLWLANLTADPCRVAIDGMTPRRGAALDLEHFAAARDRADALVAGAVALDGATLDLGPYAVMRIEG